MVEDLSKREVKFGREGHGLGEGGDVDGREVLVDHLGAGTEADASGDDEESLIRASAWDGGGGYGKRGRDEDTSDSLRGLREKEEHDYTP